MALKNRVKPGMAVDKILYEKVKEISEETRIPISKLFDEALEDLITKHNNLAGKR